MRGYVPNQLGASIAVLDGSGRLLATVVIDAVSGDVFAVTEVGAYAAAPGLSSGD